MIHQPMGGASGQASELEITVREIMKIKSELYAIISQHTGKSMEQVEKDADRDYWMTAEEAVKYGMIDEVLVRNKK
jgi:ATP-dependent Clp protease protease subunit